MSEIPLSKRLDERKARFKEAQFDYERIEERADRLRKNHRMAKIKEKREEKIDEQMVAIDDQPLHKSYMPKLIETFLHTSMHAPAPMIHCLRVIRKICADGIDSQYAIEYFLKTPFFHRWNAAVQDLKLVKDPMGTELEDLFHLLWSSLACILTHCFDLTLLSILHSTHVLDQIKEFMVESLSGRNQPVENNLGCLLNILHNLAVEYDSHMDDFQPFFVLAFHKWVALPVTNPLYFTFLHHLGEWARHLHLPFSQLPFMIQKMNDLMTVKLDEEHFEPTHSCILHVLACMLEQRGNYPGEFANMNDDGTLTSDDPVLCIPFDLRAYLKLMVTQYRQTQFAGFRVLEVLFRNESCWAMEFMEPAFLWISGLPIPTHLNARLELFHRLMGQPAFWIHSPLYMIEWVLGNTYRYMSATKYFEIVNDLYEHYYDMDEIRLIFAKFMNFIVVHVQTTIQSTHQQLIPPVVVYFLDLLAKKNNARLLVDLDDKIQLRDLLEQLCQYGVVRQNPAYMTMIEGLIGFFDHPDLEEHCG